jgi:hypothetical protein
MTDEATDLDAFQRHLLRDQLNSSRHFLVRKSSDTADTDGQLFEIGQACRALAFVEAHAARCGVDALAAARAAELAVTADKLDELRDTVNLMIARAWGVTRASWTPQESADADS